MRARRAFVAPVVGVIGLVAAAPTSADQPVVVRSDLPASTQVILAVSHAGRSVVYADSSLGTAGAHRTDVVTGATIDLPPLRAVSADGSAVITIDGAWMDVDTGVSVPIPERADFTTVLLTADGRTYAAGGPEGTKGWVIDGATQQRVALPRTGVPLAISPAGRFVLIGSSCGTLSSGSQGCDTTRWDRLTNRTDVVARVALDERLESGIADSGRVVVSTAAAGFDRAYVARDLAGVRHDIGSIPLTRGLQLSSDGEVFLRTSSQSSAQRTVTAVDIASGQTIGTATVLNPPIGGPFDVHLTGDGARLVYLFSDAAHLGQGPRSLVFVSLDHRHAAPRLVHDEVLQVAVAGRAGVGPDASAAMLNVTVTNPAAAGFLTAWPCGRPRPLASNINFAAGANVATAVLAAVGDDGSVCLSANVDLDVVVDVEGWLDADAPYEAIAPARAIDTRGADDDAVANVVAFHRTAVSLVGAGVPADSPGAMLSVTVTNPDQPGYVTVWPCGELQPLASNLNFTAGQTVANAVLARPGTDRSVCVASNVATDVIVDVQGWFLAGSGYTGAVPGRLIDTRHGELDTVANVPAGTNVEIPLPAGADAAMLNVTATNPANTGFVTVWTCGQPRPTASNLNFAAGQTMANAVLAVAGDAQSACAWSSVDVDLVVDLQGTLASGSPYRALPPTRLVDTRI